MLIRPAQLFAGASIAASLFAAADLNAAPPCAVAVQPVPIYQTPYGYYPTQWRSYPIFGEQAPPIAIVFPSETLTAPTRVVPQRPPIVAPKKFEAKPIEPAPMKMDPAPTPMKLDPTPVPMKLDPAPEPKKTLSTNSLPSPYNQMILPPDYKPEETSFARGVQPVPVMPDPRRQLVEPEITILLPKQPDVLKEAGEELSEVKPPTQPKAWLELPIAVPTPTIRGSSYELREKIRWESSTRK